MKCVSLFTSTLMLLAVAHPASAWWEEGHIIVAKIAEKHLTKEAQAGIKMLLDGPEGERAISDTKMCNWADLIRGSGQLNRKYPKNDTWHYINIELKQKKDDWKPDENGNDVIGAIERFKKVLADPKADKQDRKEALLFVVHFVGDMHQPLHIGEKHDRGGNDVVAAYGFKAPARMNLHRIWDSDLAERALTEPPAITPLSPDARQRRAMAAGSIADWARESWNISRTIAYPELRNYPDTCPAASKIRAVIDADYIKAATPAVRLQAERAGLRLARLLNTALGR